MLKSLAARLILSAHLCLSFAAASAAQAPRAQGRFTFRTYGVQDGLGNLAVIALHQDRTGFLWVGTEDGLYRYDGQAFQVFGTVDGLPSSYITSFAEGDTGRLWAGTFAGLAVRKGNGFVAAGPESGLPSGPVVDLATQNRGTVAVAMSNGIYLQQGPGLSTFVAIPGWPGGLATALGADPATPTIWTASFNGQARVLSYAGGAWKIWEGEAGFGGKRIDAVVPDGQGSVWARDADHLWVLRKGMTRFERVVPGPPSISARATLRVDPDGSLYVPTDAGLWILRGGHWTVLDQNSGLASSRTRDALKDREGSLWVSNLGLNRLLGRGLWRAYSSQDGLPDSVIWTIFRSRKATLYVGTDRGLGEQTPSGWKAIPATAGQVIRAVAEAPDGSFYLGSLPARVLHWNPSTGRVDAVYGTESGLGGKRLFHLLLDPEGRLWASTEDSGLYCADTHAKKLHFTRVDLPGGTPTEYVNGLDLGASGRIYASGEKGLAVLDHGTWRRYTAADGLKGDFVSYAKELKDGEILVGYFEAHGLSRMRMGADGSLHGEPPNPSDMPLDREKVYMMGEDSRDRIWIGTGRGVFVLQGKETQHFGLADGLVSEDIDNMAFLSDPGGDVWVGTSGGLARFDAAAYQGAPHPPTTVFLSCDFAGQAVDLEEAPPQVPYRENTLEARFAGLSFLGERRIEHAVQLKGLESGWHVTDTQETRYPALAPGSYTLMVRSRVMQGEWGPIATFRFEVLPAWWQTWWFRSLMVLAGAGLVTALIGWRMSSLRKHNEELAALVHARTAELEEANEALRSQSLTDSLTGLKNRRYLGICMPDDTARVRRTHREVLDQRVHRSHVNIDIVLVMVDLDHFKEVNDLYGHAAGDLVLQQVAEILGEATRETDTVVRWGGEEFLVVARNAARKDAIVLVERIRSRMAAHVFDLGDGRTLRRTCSLGFALMPFLCAEPDYMNWEEVVDVADHCLYVAKHSGRDAWVGVAPGNEVTSARLGPKVPQRLHELIGTPMVEVLTSLPDASGLVWENES